MPKTELGDMLVVDALGRLDGKLDRLDERLDGVDKLMVKQQEILDEHVRRTDLLEKKLHDDITGVKAGIPEAVDKQLTENRIKYVKLIAKGAAALAGTGVGVAAIKAALTWILANWK